MQQATMNQPLTTTFPADAAVGPDSYLSPVPTKAKLPKRTTGSPSPSPGPPAKSRSLTPTRMPKPTTGSPSAGPPAKSRSLTPSRMRALSPSKMIKKGIQRLASPARRRMSDCNDTNQQKQQANKVVNQIKRIAPLHRLAKHRLWDEIIGILNFEPEAVIMQWLQRCQTVSRGPIPNGSPLHVVLFFQPPLEVVDLLLKAMRRMLGPNAVPEDSIDPQRSQTPLHIAVATGCEYSVVDRLTTITAAQTVDSEGRTPLHWACTSKPFPDRKTIKLLVAVYPGARKVADAFEFTPLMIAQYHRAKKDVLHLLQPTTYLHPPRDNENGEVVVAEDETSTSFVPEDLPLVVTLGKSFTDISCLYVPPEIEKPRRAGKRPNQKHQEQQQPPSSPTKSVRFKPGEACFVTIEDDDSSSSHHVPEDLPMVVSVSENSTDFGEVSCLQLPEIDGMDDSNKAPTPPRPETRPTEPTKQEQQQQSSKHHKSKTKKSNTSDDLSKAGDSTTSSKRSSTRSSMSPGEMYEAVEL